MFYWLCFDFECRRFFNSVRVTQATRLYLPLSHTSGKDFVSPQRYRGCNESSQWLMHCRSNFERRSKSCTVNAYEENTRQDWPDGWLEVIIGWSTSQSRQMMLGLQRHLRSRKLILYLPQYVAGNVSGKL
ncbi:hypothetical protein NPIL_469521 [Nephila pilipes]|uniref:Uncharacterized protein n=1 Tax=Nephila pilipes TaxID=299642 RepID=A0A8X6NGF3_NEPPI|nr:hypothetical protein NPIL_469521 [Nephila pilipes]